MAMRWSAPRAVPGGCPCRRRRARRPRTAKLSDLQTIVHLRMEETFGLIRARLQQQKLLHLLGAAWC